jgi:hypothetical protein
MYEILSIRGDAGSSSRHNFNVNCKGELIYSMCGLLIAGALFDDKLRKHI